MFVSTGVKLWLFISSIIVTWDYLFVLLRPATLPGGNLNKFWKPYSKYIEIDTLYKSESDRFIIIQSYFNIFETLLNFTCLLMIFFMSKSVKWQVFNGLFTLICISFTFWKTAIYFIYDDVFINYNTNTHELILLFLIPNSMWLIGPIASMIDIIRRFIRVLNEIYGKNGLILERIDKNGKKHE